VLGALLRGHFLGLARRPLALLLLQTAAQIPQQDASGRGKLQELQELHAAHRRHSVLLSAPLRGAQSQHMTQQHERAHKGEAHPSNVQIQAQGIALLRACIEGLLQALELRMQALQLGSLAVHLCCRVPHPPISSGRTLLCAPLLDMHIRL
jgi:hypothetical protein